MSGQKLIWLLLAIAAVATMAGIWQFSNSKGYRARGRRRDPAPGDNRANSQAGRSQRMTDTRQLSGTERKLYKESQRLLAEGKVPPAARILEQLNMPREAIQCLEDHGYIDEAAKILMRMQRHNRAGVIYARHGMWDKAAQCFKLANMPLEVAKSARQANNLAVAAEYFEKVGRLEDAAKCCVDAGDFLRAGRLFLQANQTELAMSAWAQLPKGASAEQLTEQELEQIVGYIGEGHVMTGLADIVASRNKLPEAVLALCTKGLAPKAADLYRRTASDIGPQLMADVNYQDRSAETLASLFISVSQHHYAGMVFERMGKFDRAAATFEKAEDFDRAAYCYERASNDLKVREMKEKAKAAPAGGRARHANPAFALANVTRQEVHASDAQDSDSAETEAEGSGESTAVIDMSSGIPVPAHPMPPPPPSPPRAVAPPPPPPRAAPSEGAFSLGAMEDTDENEAPAEAAPPPAPVVPFSKLSAVDDENSDEADTPLPTAAAQPRDAQPPLDEDTAAFHKAKFLVDLDFEQKSKVWSIGVTESYGNGEVILTYNDEPKGLYVITDGSVYVFRSQGGREQAIDTIGAGESFGELWLLADQPTAVRFVAATPARIRVVSREAFTELLDKDGTIARKIYKKFTMRLLKRLLAPQNHAKNQAAS